MTDQAQTDAQRGKETGTDLWRVILPPSIWAVHFLTCYVVAAVYCEKAGRAAALDPVRSAVIGLTLAGVAVILMATRGVWQVRGRSLTDDDFEYEHNTAEERHRFLSHVSLMLSALSVVGMVFVMLPAVLLETCR